MFQNSWVQKNYKLSTVQYQDISLTQDVKLTNPNLPRWLKDNRTLAFQTYLELSNWTPQTQFMNSKGNCHKSPPATHFITKCFQNALS